MTIAEKLDIIKDRISDSAKKVGKSPKDIFLLPVTKTKTPEEIMPALACGIRAIGENYVQELLQKYDALAPYVDEFHMIGHLQSNKVKYLIDKVCLIHSVDSVSLLTEIDRQAKKHGKRQEVLLEVNLTKEDSKFGIYEEQLEEVFQSGAMLPHVQIKGFMTMPPLDYTEDKLRRVFSKLFAIYEHYRAQDANITVLSMGMSHDYPIAIEEGSNLVRIGSAIFGPRTYQSK